MTILIPGTSAASASSGMVHPALFGTGLTAADERDFTHPLIATDGSTVLQIDTQTTHTMRRGGSVLAPLYGNFSGWFAAGPPVNAITVRAAALWGGSWWPFYFGGLRDVVIGIDDFAAPKPLGIPHAVGDIITIRTRAVVASGETIYQNVTTDPASEGVLANASHADHTTDGAGISLGNAYGYGPVKILSPYIPGQRPAVAGVGDSILDATGDVNEVNAYRLAGFVKRAVDAAGNPYIALGQGGDLARYFETSNDGTREVRLRFALAAGAAIIVWEEGTNDVNGARTAAQIKASLLAGWKRAAAGGARVYQTTITPWSGGDFTTTGAGQTVNTNDAARTATNDWIRAGAPIDPTTLAVVAIGTSGALVAGATGHPLHGYFETADAVESARNSGKWKANYTADGAHPEQVGHQAMAAVIPASAFDPW